VTLTPSFTFGILLGALYGALGHLIIGGNVRRLIALILAAWIGFAIGQAAGQVMDIRALAVGSVNVLSASLGSLIAVAAAAVLSARRRAAQNR
jgi:hypothetical protein